MVYRKPDNTIDRILIITALTVALLLGAIVYLGVRGV